MVNQFLFSNFKINSTLAQWINKNLIMTQMTDQVNLMAQMKAAKMTVLMAPSKVEKEDLRMIMLVETSNASTVTRHTSLIQPYTLT